ncbi:SIS domain-containing protein [Paracoccus sp. P2]|uniref:SIS domain-containing protein n=1 Tax=Paracoccus sp. P2 TaxID=3248840 RepID=UPI00391F1A79
MTSGGCADTKECVAFPKRQSPLSASTKVAGLMRAGAKDVLLAISINPYARHSLELAQLAREKGMGVVAITGSDAVTAPRRPLCAKVGLQ